MIKNYIQPFTGVMKIILKVLNISMFIRQLLCDHDYRYWRAQFRSRQSGISDTIVTKWRRCDKCNRKQELDTRPGSCGWKKSNYNLPENTDIVIINVKLIGDSETLQEKRNKIIDKILK